MNNIEKMEKIRYINKYLRNFTEKQSQIIDKLSAQIADEALEELCGKYGMCDVCGKDLVPNVRLMVREQYPQVMCREIFIKGCSDASCKYNKHLVARYEN